MIEGLNFEAVGQGEFVQLGSDGLGAQGINGAPDGEIDIGGSGVAGKPALA